jgi:hypothetical protein
MTVARLSILAVASLALAGTASATPMATSADGPFGLVTDSSFNEYQLAQTAYQIDGPGTYFYDSVFISLRHPNGAGAGSETGNAAFMSLKIGGITHTFWIPYSVVVTANTSKITFAATAPVEYDFNATDDFLVSSLAATFDYATPWNALFLNVALTNPPPPPAVPEPGSLVIMSVGLLGLSATVRARRPAAV